MRGTAATVPRHQLHQAGAVWSNFFSDADGQFDLREMAVLLEQAGCPRHRCWLPRPATGSAAQAVVCLWLEFLERAFHFRAAKTTLTRL